MVAHGAQGRDTWPAMDWIDEADGVFRGGGVKGIGLAGALSGFAEHPTKPVRRWVNVAGASAGAIIASYLAVGHTAEEMVDLLRRTPFA
jgi:NTE family protein